MSLVDQGVVSLTNFCTSVFIARACSREELGLYSLGFSILLFSTSIQSSIISLPYTVNNPKFKNTEKMIYSGSTLTQQLILTILFVLIIGATGFFLPMVSGPDALYRVIQIISLAIPFVLIREFGRQFFISRMNINSALLIDTIVFIVQLTMLFIFLKLNFLSASNAFLIITGACLIAVIIFFYTVQQAYSVKKDQIFSHFKMNWIIGKWAVFSGFASLAGMQLYPWLMRTYRGLGDTGILAACFGIVFIINPLILGLGNYLAAKIMHIFAEQGIQFAHKFLIKCCKLFLGIMFVFCIGMFCFGGELLEMIYGSKYQGFNLVVSLLAFGLSCEIVSLPYNCGLYMLEKSNFVFLASLINFVTTITLGFWLLVEFGPVGVGLGLIFGYSLTGLFRWFSYYYFYRTLSNA